MCVITGYCKRGVYLEMAQEITLGRDGVCGDYMVFEEKEKIDLNARNEEIVKLLEKCESEDDSNYNYKIHISGGDGCFQTHAVKEEFENQYRHITSQGVCGQRHFVQWMWGMLGFGSAKGLVVVPPRLTIVQNLNGQNFGER